MIKQSATGIGGTALTKANVTYFGSMGETEVISGEQTTTIDKCFVYEPWDPHTQGNYVAFDGKSIKIDPNYSSMHIPLCEIKIEGDTLYISVYDGSHLAVT